MSFGFVVLISAWQWLERLGGLGLIALGISDAFVGAAAPGSVDALTIVLAASKRDWWPYYALMATLGSVLGSYLTFRVGRKGGRAALEKRIPKKHVEKVYRTFGKGGFGAVFVPSLLPPPVPMMPFVLAAGALNYSTRKFLFALTAGRSIRFFAVAFLASIYGRKIVGFLQEYYQPVLWSFVGLALAGAAVSTVYFYRKRHKDATKPARKEAA